MNMYENIKKAARDFQKYLEVPLFLLDKNSKIIYTGDENILKKEGFFDVNREYMEKRDIFEWQNITFNNIFIEDRLFLTVGIYGTGEKTENLLLILSKAFEHLNNQLSKEDFLFELLTGNIEKDEILYYIEKYKFNKKDLYRIIIIESSDVIDDAVKIVGHIFDKNSYYTVILSTNRFAILLLDVADTDIDKATRILKDTIESEVYIKVSIGVSNKPLDLINMNYGYKEACTALEIGKKLDNDEKGIYFYNNYVLAELLMGLPEDIIKRFLNVMAEGKLDCFNDDELMQTLNAFFKNSLNLSETSRDLYIHRNTLVYRLDKIHKMTELDPKQFDDAMMLKIIMLLVKLFKD
ncbi:helix-turn-helix domain-containing protein [Thermoanaerobacterium sp. RBIITD]|uniref:PucR family transcriptional regulator n=1 Tax=Thermoanaerobacterium sp. RBIITD TaxID=1550240 RepID=UPI000BB79588|nr:helix-turn-helix domain-containing protein [Thermoanaerobacterium sp. RBIITD]SNX54606.1 carbohydrate diacid regulator [Thermoanaerobacterium sp. RBIITD]